MFYMKKKIIKKIKETELRNISKYYKEIFNYMIDKVVSINDGLGKIQNGNDEQCKNNIYNENRCDLLKSIRYDNIINRSNMYIQLYPKKITRVRKKISDSVFNKGKYINISLDLY